jgi:hypothetical protein
MDAMKWLYIACCISKVIPWKGDVMANAAGCAGITGLISTCCAGMTGICGWITSGCTGTTGGTTGIFCGITVCGSTVGVFTSELDTTGGAGSIGGNWVGG